MTEVFDYEKVDGISPSNGLCVCFDRLRKKQLTMTSIDISDDTEVVLKAIEVNQENAYEPPHFTKGIPLTIDVEKGAWFKIGIAMQNPTDEDIVVCINVENVKVRIE